MLKKIDTNSLYFKLNLIIFIVITLGTVLQTAYHVLDIKNSVSKQILQQSKVNLFEIKESIMPFVDSYEVSEYENILKTNIIHSEVSEAVILHDYKTGKILGKTAQIIGFYKNENGVLLALSNDDTWKTNVLFQDYKQTISTEVLNKNNEKIASIKFYLSNNIVNEHLKKYFIDNIILILFFYFILLLASYLLIKHFFSRPLENIINTLEKNSKNVSLMENLDEHSSSEFSILSNNFNDLLGKIEDSKEELKKSTLKWEFALEGRGDGLWEWDIKNNIVFFSKQWKKMLGFEDSELENNFETWSNLMHPEDMQTTLDRVEKYLNGQTDYYINEHRLKCKDGSYKWILAKGFAIQRDDEDKPAVMMGTHTDITQAKEYEISIQEAAVVFENTNDGILLTDKNKKIINVNKSFEIMSGYKKEELIGKNPGILKSGHQDAKFYADMWDKINKDGFWSGNLIDRKENGENYEIMTSINAISINNEVMYYVAVFHDITIFKKQEKIIFQQSKTAALGEMIGNISHQWRQPLSIISTASTGLKLLLEYSDKLDKNEIITQLNNINETTQYLSNTIDDFRNFFQTDMLDKVPFSIEEAITKAKKLTKDSLENNFIKYHEEVRNIKISGYESLLIQVIINIINNAIDKLKENNQDEKLIFIKAFKEDDKAKIIIYDNAGGIPENILDKIFDPYFTTKHESVGTGLGLYMTFEIITKQFGGEILASNLNYTFEDKQQKGAQFTIVLNDLIEY